MRTLGFVLLFGMVGACGDDPEATLRLAFQVHALDCEVPGLDVRLEASNLPGQECGTSEGLVVNADRTVSGSCSGIPTGSVVNFRLVYLTLVESVNTQVELATVVASLDLTDPSDSVMRLDFSDRPIMTNFDFDADGMTNIEEFCVGRNPAVPGI